MNIKSIESIFYDIEKHMLNDKKPSEFLMQISNEPIFSEYPFSMLLKLKKTNQQLEYHPEGNVWNHTLMVVDEAAKRKNKSKNSKIFMWAALLHDIGKPDTTKIRKGKITSYNHDKVGADLTIQFLFEFNLDEDFIEGVSALVRWHMQILFVVKELPFAEVKLMKEQADINDVVLLGLCDRLGRGKVNYKKEMANVNMFFTKIQ